jgi:hypothetical protein
MAGSVVPLHEGSDVEDITSLLDDELGSQFDHETLLFQGFDDGNIFNYDLAQVNETDDMLAVDGKAETLLQALTLPVRNVRFTIKKGTSDLAVHKFIDDFFNAPANNGGMSTPMRVVIGQMLMAIAYRKSFHEKVLTIREVNDKLRVVYDKVAWRPPTTCAIVRDQKFGSFKGYRQMPIRYEDTEEIWIKPQRAFVYIHNQHRNPLEGKSDLDIAHWCYITKQKIRFLWYQFLEGQSLPKTIVRSRTETDANKAAAKLITLRQGGVVGLTDQITTDVLESSGKGADQFLSALRWLDAEASGSVLAGFTDLGAAAASGTGSFALSKDQTSFFQMGRDADAREVADTITNFLIADLVRYNFGPTADCPEFEFGPIQEDDATQAIALLQATAQSPNQVLPKAFMDELIERVAGLLGLNTQVVRQGLTKQGLEASAQLQAANPGNPFAEKAGFVSGAVGAATNAIVRNQQQLGGPKRGFESRLSGAGA